MILSKKPRGEQMMRLIRFGKGQRLSNIPANSLASRVVPSFDKGGFSWFFSDTPLGFCGEDLLRGVPEIAEGVAVFVVIRNVIPEAKAGCAGFDLQSRRRRFDAFDAHRRPEPASVGFFEHKAPDLIQLQDIT